MNDLIVSELKELGKSALSKVSNKFIDFVITKATGKSIKVFEAEGDIEADKVKTKWEIIEKPFWIQAEAIKMQRQYSNFGDVLKIAAPLITTPTNKIADDNDMFWGLLEHSKEIKNEEMQVLIAKIIAGEYNIPGTYSMSTLQVLKMLSKTELELFERICGFIVNGNQLPNDLFSGQDNVKELMKKTKLDFGHLQSLQSLGLVLPNSMESTLQNTESKNIIIQYFDKMLIYSPNESKPTTARLPSFYCLSVVGTQILRHLKPVFNEEYYHWLLSNYKIPAYDLSDQK